MLKLRWSLYGVALLKSFLDKNIKLIMNQMACLHEHQGLHPAVRHVNFEVRASILFQLTLPVMANIVQQMCWTRQQAANFDFPWCRNMNCQPICKRYDTYDPPPELRNTPCLNFDVPPLDSGNSRNC